MKKVTNNMGHRHDMGLQMLGPGESVELDDDVIDKLLLEPYFKALVEKKLFRITRPMAEKSASQSVVVQSAPSVSQATDEQPSEEERKGWRRGKRS